MAYFNNAFNKTFVATGVVKTASTATSALTAGQLALVDGSDWESVAVTGGGAVPVIAAGDLAYVVQGSVYTKDTIGNNPGHGGYKESVKSKGINPRYITRLWSADCTVASQATAKLCLASDCAPCGKTQFMRIDVKGSPALRFLNHNAYAIGDSANVCCIDGQEFIDPAVVAATMAKMVLGDPLIKPFVAEKSGGGIDVTVTVSGVATTTTYTVAQVLDGTYTPSTDPTGTDKVSACMNFVGAYVDTTFGNCSFDTRDHYNAEPVEVILSLLDETGNPCNDCGVASRTPGSMQQTQGEEVIRELILSERYRQSPYNQGNADSARIREIEMSDELLASVDRTKTYKAYYIQHSVPRFNNPSGVFDNDQYVYKIYAECGADVNADIIDLMEDIQAWAGDNGNKIAFDQNSY
tara:strand:- start:2037 stop:3263 length:1227 start_codon:yes stop_codon:yes gene_type:complete